jgi:hypothetical protein
MVMTASENITDAVSMAALISANPTEIFFSVRKMR